MKRLLLFFSVLNVLILYAQTDSLTVHVKGQPLTDLLTNEQKQSVNYLFLTGALTEEDYAFLRDNNLPKLHELNLRKAAIDTIPKKAFYRSEYGYGRNNEYSIILPETLEFIGDSAFNDKGGIFNYDIILTSKFPKTGFDILPSDNEEHFKISKDNPFCIAKDAIFSIDGKHLYFNYSLTTIPESVEIIEEKAFQGQMLLKLDFPKTIKEIKDYAFYNCRIPASHPSYSIYGEFIFQTKTPPTLGKEVFGGDRNSYFYDAILTVPEGCYENYITADGQWEIFKKDRNETSIDLQDRNGLQIKKTSTGTIISCDFAIKKVWEFNTQGLLIQEMSFSDNTRTYFVSRPNNSSTAKIIKILFINGKAVTIKL